MKLLKTSAYEQLPLFQEKQPESPDGKSQLVPYEPPPPPRKPTKSGVYDVRDPKQPREGYFVVLGAGNNSFLFYWGHENTIDWTEVLKEARAYVAEGGFQRSFTDIMINGNRAIIDARGDEYTWGRTRSQYTPEVSKMTKELLRRGFVQPQSPILLGNWARRDGHPIGSAQEVSETNVSKPQQLVMYHGTADVFIPQILSEGLKPMPRDQRIWKDIGGKKGHPEHREEAVYLSASPPQAAYYAEKAARVARRRGFKVAKPAVVQVVLTPEDYAHLKADDDWMQLQSAEKNKHRAKPERWYESLTEMGQVALVRPIPPNRIKQVPVPER